MTIRQLKDHAFAANCDGCGQQYADEESGDYLFASLAGLARLMGADGWRADPVLCPACQPAGVVSPGLPRGGVRVMQHEPGLEIPEPATGTEP